MPLKRQADEKQRAWRRVFRQKYRERLRSAPGVPMHPKNDPKSDRVCCLQSSGLCQTMGSKHHRRNKKCWLFPYLCEHCDAVRAVSSEDDELTTPLTPAVVEKSLAENKEQYSTRSVVPSLNDMANQASVDLNNRFRISTSINCEPDAVSPEAHSLMIPTIMDSSTPEQAATQTADQSLGRAVIRSQQEREIVDSIEDEPPLAWPQTPPATPPTLSMGEHELLDFEQRVLRSQAPSPDAYRSRETWPSGLNSGPVETYERRSTIPSGAPQPMPWSRESQSEFQKRDPRLDLRFVLEIA